MEATVFYVLTSQTIPQFEAKNSEIKRYSLCLVNFPKYFTVNNMKNRIKWICIQFFS